MTSVVVVDDQELVRTGFAMILERAGIEVLAQAGSGEEGVAMALEHRPDVVLMDVRMPGMDGIEATRRLVTGPEPPRVLVLTTFDLDEHVFAAVEAGASGFLLKDVAPDDLAHAVRVVARGEAMLAPALIRRLLDRFSRPARAEAPAVPLSERETAVARLVARGRSNTEIAAELFLSEATVKTYVSRLFTKLEVRDRVQVAVWAYESGLVRVGEESAQARPD
jgi:DNA-binding NarL/FixJ family response regulator